MQKMVRNQENTRFSVTSWTRFSMAGLPHLRDTCTSKIITLPVSHFDSTTTRFGAVTPFTPRTPTTITCKENKNNLFYKSFLSFHENMLSRVISDNHTAHIDNVLGFNDIKVITTMWQYLYLYKRKWNRYQRYKTSLFDHYVALFTCHLQQSNSLWVWLRISGRDEKVWNLRQGNI